MLKLIPKDTPQKCDILKLLFKFPKPISQNYFPKQFPIVAPQSCSPKHRRKAGIKVTMLQIYSPKRLPKAISQSGSRNLLPKVAAENCSPKLHTKINPQRCSLPYYSYCPKLLPKPTPQTCSTKLFPEALPKINIEAAPNSYTPKVLQLPLKLFVKAASLNYFFKISPQNYYFSKSLVTNSVAKPRIAPHSYSPKLPSKITTESRVPKKLPKIARTG